MSAASRRGASAEERAAAALGTKRIRRAHYGISAPDVEPIKLPSGDVIFAEIKSRARLPVLMTGALSQAERYAKGRGIPIAVLFQKGAHRGIVALDLDAFVRLVGLDVAKLPTSERKAPRELCQVPLLDTERSR